jgi:hypothetical protein
MLRPRGSDRSCCTAGRLADALRRLGFVRERRWHDGRSSFRALWRKRQVRTSDRAAPSTLIEDARAESRDRIHSEKTAVLQLRNIPQFAVY